MRYRFNLLPTLIFSLIAVAVAWWTVLTALKTPIGY